MFFFDLVGATKALCSEIQKCWQAKFLPYGINVGLVTGDADPKEINDLCDLRTYQIIVATPEKFDAVTRSWRSQSNSIIADKVKLMLIDEIHLVGDESRGSTYEAIVARVKTFPSKIRFLVASASLFNIDDVANWIGSNDTSNSVRIFR